MTLWFQEVVAAANLVVFALSMMVLAFLGDTLPL